MRTRVAIPLMLLLVILAAANLLPSHAQRSNNEAQVNAPPPLSNPLKVALLKWYPANTVPTQFPVGNQPYGIAFDGANVWTANMDDGTVSKVRTSDGSLQGTFPAVNAAYGVTYDGANVWVSGLGGTVVKLRGSDGKLLGSFAVGANPGWMAFDGANIWVPNGSNTVTKLRAVDGSNLGNFTVGVNPIAAACDGTAIWVVDGGGNGTGSVLRSGPVTVRCWAPLRLV